MRSDGADALLDIWDLCISFDGVQVLNGTSLSVAEGEFLGLIGPNGAGKTTLLNVISNLYRPSAGSIRFAGEEIANSGPGGIAKRGIARTFQSISIVPELNVLANVMLGGGWRDRPSLPARWLVAGAVPAWTRCHEEEALRAIDAVGLSGQRNVVAGELSHGDKRRVELARALCARPRLLMLDEPASGLGDADMASLVDLLRILRKESNLTVIAIEHHLDVVLALSDRIAVLDLGRVIASGPPDSVMADPAVLSAYVAVA